MHALGPILLCALILAGRCAPAHADEPVEPDDSREVAHSQSTHAPDDAGVTNSIGMKLCWIPAGEFTMGSPETDPDAAPDERPARRVQIRRPFYLGAFEVTQAQYAAVVGEDHSWFSARGPGRHRVEGLDTSRFPVDMVSWEDAVAFCARLSDLPAEKAAGRRYRLPTEAEWEYACRAGSETRYHVGDRLTPEAANLRFGEPAGKLAGRPVPVGRFAPNAWGLYDLHGNVWEWCADWYAHDYYRRAPAADPAGPSEGTGHVVRGGDWSFGPEHGRAANRDFTRTTRRNLGAGFRVACQAEGAGPP